MQRSSSSWCLARSRGQTDRRRSASSSRAPVEPQLFEYKEETHDSYANFLLKVNCPLCSKTEPDKSALMKHLEKDCTKKKKSKKELKFTMFKILPSGAIQCRICKNVEFATIETYFYHLTNGHQRRMGRPLVENYTTRALYCGPCRMRVPNNKTQLEFHLKNRFHLRKRKADLNGHQLRVEYSAICIYSFFNGKKKFKCLECVPPLYLSTPLDLIGHFKTPNHPHSDEFIGKESIHCDFCEINISIYEVGYHFTSEGHLLKEGSVSEAETYEVCPFCGFSSDSIPELSEHVTVTCPEVIREKEASSKVVTPKPEVRDVEEAPGGGKEGHKVNRRHTILVNDDINIVALIKILKKVGDIIYVGPYNNDFILIEFKEEPPIEQIYLIRQLIKIDGKKVDLRFL